MQELLGRIARLDPSASLGLRVIACFDELVVGNVNTRALLAAAASLAGCVAGFAQETPARVVRVAPSGHFADGTAAAVVADDPRCVVPADGLRVWLEREGDAQPNDAIILERLALALRLRHAGGRWERDARRDLGVLLDDEQSEEDRLRAAAALRLPATGRFRVVAAPLFAVWRRHPEGAEDVISTPYGPIHALVLPEDQAEPAAAPCGVGVAAAVVDLHLSFRTALVALRLSTPAEPAVEADAWAGLVELLADTPETRPHADADAVAGVTAHPWGAETLDALLRTQTVREAARALGVHHSTLQSRLDLVSATLGYDPVQGYGRVRLGVAYLVHRLRTSRVLELPPPTA